MLLLLAVNVFCQVMWGHTNASRTAEALFWHRMHIPYTRSPSLVPNTTPENRKGIAQGNTDVSDYKNEKLTLLDKLASAQTEGFSRIPIETDSNHPGKILVPIDVTVIPGKVISGKALLDTGSGKCLEFTSKAAAKYGLDKIQEKNPFYYKHGGVGGESAGYEFAVDKVTADSVLLSQGKARYSTDKAGAMASDEYIAVAGNEIWRHFTIIIDLNKSVLFLKENL